MEQAPDDALFATLDAESNSIAIIVKHLAGNMRSRWTDFLTSDGEKPDRNRDSEFEVPPATRAELIAHVGIELEDRLRRARAADGRGPRPHNLHSRRGALRHAGDQSADRALRVSRRTDRLSGETFFRAGVEIADGAARTNRRNSTQKWRQARRLSDNCRVWFSRTGFSLSCICIQSMQNCDRLKPVLLEIHLALAEAGSGTQLRARRLLWFGAGQRLRR